MHLIFYVLDKFQTVSTPHLSDYFQIDLQKNLFITH